MLLPALLCHLRRPDGHPRPHKRRHQLHPLLLHEPTVPTDVREAVQAARAEKVVTERHSDRYTDYICMMYLEVPDGIAKESDSFRKRTAPEKACDEEHR